MLRLYDPRAGTVSDLRPAVPGVLSLRVPSAASDLTDLRVQLVADLVRRVAERRKLRVLVAQESTDRNALETLNVRPAPLDHLDAADLTVASGDNGDKEAGADRSVVVGPVRIAEPESLSAVSARRLDPLSVRLAVLQRPYREPLDLTWESLEFADAELRHWRAEVAFWAESPSKPMSTNYLDEAMEALGDDLDSPEALEVARRLAADADEAPGAKFETFVHLDLVLALDLVRDIGRAGQ